MAAEKTEELYDTVSDVLSYTSFSYDAYSVKTTVLGRAARPQQGQLSGGSKKLLELELKLRLYISLQNSTGGPIGLQTTDLDWSEKCIYDN